MEFDKVLELLPSLSVEQLAEIENRIAFLKQSSKRLRVKLVTIDDEFYDALRNKLLEKGIKLPSFNNFEKIKAAVKYKENMGVVNEFTKKYFDGISKLDRHKLYGIYAELILDYVEEQKKGTNINYICNCVQAVPDLFNKAFPGYIESGVAKAILGIL